MTVPSRTTLTDALRRTTPDDDHAAGDRAEPGDLEQRAHLGLPEDLLGRDRGEHPDERLLDVLRELVDDAVRADVDALALGELARLAARPHVEADHERVRGGCEVDVVLGDPADAGVDDVDPNLGVLDLAELAQERLDGALDVALQDDVEVLHGTGLHLLEERLERHAACLRALRELLAAETLGALLGEILRLALVLDDARQLTRGRRPVEAEDLDRVARPGLLHLLATVVVERAHLAGGVPCDDRVADAERPALDEHGGDGPASHVEPRLDDRPGRVGLRVRAKVELGVRDEENLLEELVEVRLLLGRDLGELRRAAPVLGLKALGGELALDAVGVRVRACRPC